MKKALTAGISFDGSSIQGFARLEESDMVLRLEISTYQIIPWYDEDYRIVRFICSVYTTKGEPFTGVLRYIFQCQLEKLASLGYTFNVRPEMEFFLFIRDEAGHATIALQDHGRYVDQTSTNPGEDVRCDWLSDFQRWTFRDGIRYRGFAS